MADEQTYPAAPAADTPKSVPRTAQDASAPAAVVTDPETVEEPTNAPTAVPVTVDNRTRRSDDDAVEGSFVDVVDGEHAGRFGSFRQVLQHDRVTGYPKSILVRTRDEFNELLEVAYEHVRPSKRTGGR